jgi:hypothetical protein
MRAGGGLRTSVAAAGHLHSDINFDFAQYCALFAPLDLILHAAGAV